MTLKDILEFITLCVLLGAIILYMILLIEHKIDEDNILLLYMAIGLNSLGFILSGIYVFFFGIPCNCEKGVLYSLL